MNELNPYRLGIDLGGTKVEGVVLDPAGRELFRSRIRTESSRGYDHVLDQVATMYARLRDAIDARPHTLGIGTPGSVARRSGLLRNSNTAALNGKPVAADLATRFGRAFTIENDANCFALAEALHGAGRGNRMVFGVIMGTGCGGGLVIDGQLHVGRQGIGGEWGHMSIDRDGPRCYCGQRGCVETFISGPGLAARHADRCGMTLDAATIVERARAGDALCAASMAAFYDSFGRALANLIDILDPDVIVLGGGLSNIDALYVEGIAAVRAQVFASELDTPIVRHSLGDSAGVIGAALIGR